MPASPSNPGQLSQHEPGSRGWRSRNVRGITLCYERGIEFDPGSVPNELVELAQVNLAHPAWDGRSFAQELHMQRVAERRERRDAPEWFSAQDLVWESWELEASRAA